MGAQYVRQGGWLKDSLVVNRFLVLHHYLPGIIVGLIIIWPALGVIQNRTISVGVSLAVTSSILSA
ncbi:hypothetical protein GE21DRAFT_1127781 [Neurospora crassa]|nr:hypothetical protein GE21DRAFT_1127781 [Neurospora crassa]